MPHTAKATSTTPARVIFLIDVSSSMSGSLATGERKMNMVWQAMRVALRDLTGQATQAGSGNIASRYLIAMYAYSRETSDLLGGFQPITEAATRQTPEIIPGNYTYTGEAFQQALDLLRAELPKIGPGDPAPLVCHLTDGQWNGQVNPGPIAQEIKSMRVNDGNVLVLNIFVEDNVLREPIPSDIRHWKGVISVEDLSEVEYVHTLYEMSSVLPDSFRQHMSDDEYNIRSGVRMLFPGNEPSMIYLGFAAATATGIGSEE